MQIQITIAKIKNLNNRSSFLSPGSEAIIIPITPKPKHIICTIFIFIVFTALFSYIAISSN